MKDLKLDLKTNCSRDEYGENYHPHTLEMYKTYVGTTHKVSNRRLTANSFFLTINTALIGINGYITGKNTEIMLPIVLSIAAIIICCFWWRLVKVYSEINLRKFKIIYQMEEQLPISPFRSEWQKKEKSKLFTDIEKNIPWVFIGLHAIIIILALNIYFNNHPNSMILLPLKEFKMEWINIILTAALVLITAQLLTAVLVLTVVWYTILLYK